MTCQGTEPDGNYYRVVVRVPLKNKENRLSGNQSPDSIPAIPIKVGVFSLDAITSIELTNKPEILNILRSKEFGEFLTNKNLVVEQFPQTKYLGSKRMRKITTIIMFIMMIIIESGCQSVIKEKSPCDNRSVGDYGKKKIQSSEESASYNYTGQPPKHIFERLKDTLAFALFKGKSGKPFTKREVVSMYFDSFRLLNKFVEFDLTHVPQQQNSPTKLSVLESLPEEFKPNILHIEGGYAILDRKAMKENQRILEENKKASKKENRNLSGNQQGDTPHDILVMCPVTRGIKETEKGKLVETPLYAGYLMGIGDNNVELKRFRSEKEFMSENSKKSVSPGPDDNSLKIGRLRNQSLFGALLDVIAPDSGRSNVISVSYALKKQELEKMKGESKEILEQLKNSQGKYIIVSTLWNKIVCPGLTYETEKYCEGRKAGHLLDLYSEGLDFIESLNSLRTTLNNLILVSVVRLQYDGDPSSGRFSSDSEEFSKREGLKKAGIEFFSILGDYTVSPIKIGQGDQQENPGEQLELLYDDQPGSSFATPLLSAIIFNLTSMNPALSSSQIKDILKQSALNNPKAWKIESSPVLSDPTLVGYIVNPDEAYKFAMGALIANAQKSRYDCKSSRLNLVSDKGEWKWLVYCGNEKANQSAQSGEDYNADVDMAGFYANAQIYTSVLHTDSAVSQVKKVAAVAPKNPERIVISDLKMEYREKDIMVEFTKEFCSPAYSDKTVKRMFINYSERTEAGIPHLDKEVVVETVPTTGCN